jgi:hypothetical protein
LRRLIPELRTLVGDDRQVLVGFGRGGWSPTLFADLHAAGFDTLTWRKGHTTDIAEHASAEHCTPTRRAEPTPGGWPTPTSSWRSRVRLAAVTDLK